MRQTEREGNGIAAFLVRAGKTDRPRKRQKGAALPTLIWLVKKCDFLYIILRTRVGV